MTTLVLNYSQSLLSVIAHSVKKTLQGMMIGMMIARQTQANAAIAQQLIRSGEYQKEDYYWLLADMNSRAILSINKEFARD